MRILGIDPGYALIGYGVIDYDGAQSFHVAAYGAISTEPKTPFELRLKKIYEDLKGGRDYLRFTKTLNLK